MLKLICVPCQRFYRPATNGVRVLEGMPIGKDVQPGTTDAARWHPYKIWVADLWRCDGCGHELIYGSGRGPISEHHLPDFPEELKRVTHKVNDC